MVTIMMSIKAWEECWHLFRDNPSLSASPQRLMDSVESIGSLNTAKKCFDGLRDLGLIDGTTGRLTPIGKRWIDSARYKEACQEIVRRFFPDALVESCHKEAMTRKGITEWLVDHEKMGEAGASKNATVFLALQEGIASGPPASREDHSLFADQQKPIKEPTREEPMGKFSISIDPSLPANQIEDILKAISESLNDKDIQIVFN